MTVDLLLPCVRFLVIIRPSNPNEPTDLEAAALYFIRHYQDVRGTNPRELEAFLGLGSAVFQDMLIRMVNRGWVVVTGMPRRLFLSEKAKVALDRPPERGHGLSSIEEGKRFWVCYDLIGGGFAVIPNRFLSKSMDDSRAVPQQVAGLDGNKAPYGRSLTGFLIDDPAFRESRDARILQALQADRMVREYLQGARIGAPPHLHVPRPGRMLTQSDVSFYRCRYDVQTAVGGGPELEADEVPPPILDCVEQNNRSVRRLGELNADRLVDFAIAARDAGNPRFLKVLRAHEDRSARAFVRPSDPLRAFMDKLSTADGDQTLDDLLETWDLAFDHLDMLMASRIDFDESRPVPSQHQREAVAKLANAARERLIISSPQVRVRSPELSTEATATLSVIAELATAQLDVSLFVHCARGTTARGQALSDDVALARLSTALGSGQVDIVDRSLDHMRTGFALTDDDAFLWQNGSLFGERPPSALLLKLRPGEGRSCLRKIGEVLPAGLSERIEGGRVLPEPNELDPRSDWPAQIAAGARDIEDMLVQANAADWADLERRVALLEDIGRQIDFISDWLRDDSDSVELIAGLTIRERASAAFGPEDDAAPLIVGLSGWSDTWASADLIDDIAHRLSRQDLSGLENVPTLICLPEGRDYVNAAERFRTQIGSIGDRCKLVREAASADRTRPTSFIMTPTSAVLAQDGLVRFVPTAGRKVKGTHLGLHLHGRRARALAAEFLREEWPDCSNWLVGSASAAKPREQPISDYRRERLMQLARTEQWFEDGNRGANRARLAICSADPAPSTNWAVPFAHAQNLLAAESTEHRTLGYALMKAVALAEDAAEIEPLGALRELARRAWLEHDLLVTAVLADFLPDDCIYRDPLTRKLALCLARGWPPSLTADEQPSLQEPSGALLSLACLLMMEGLAGDLPDWLGYIEPSSADPEREFTRSLAAYVRESDSHALDLLLLDQRGGTKQLDEVVVRLREHVISARTRPTAGRPSQVQYVNDLIFETDGSFATEMFRFLQGWEALSEGRRIEAWRRFLTRARTDLGVDLFEAGHPGGRSVKVDRLVDEYFGRKHEQMQRETNYDPILLHLGGRHMVTWLKRILTLVTEEVVPAMIRGASEEAGLLFHTARRLLESPRPDGCDDEAFLQRLVRDRLHDVDAASAVRSPAWEIPRLANQRRADWSKLRASFLKSEFRRGTAFHTVVNWFLDADRSAYRAPAEAPESADVLPLLHDLLHASDEAGADRSYQNAREALDQRLNEIADETEVMLEESRAFAKAAGMDGEGLLFAIQATDEALRTLRAHLAEQDVLSAVVLADDLRRVQRKNLRDCWQKLSDDVLEDLAKGAGDQVALELRRRLPELMRAGDLEHAWQYVELAPPFSVPIQFDDDLRLAVSEGNEPAQGAEGATPLLRLLSAARRDHGDRGSNEILAAVGMSNAVLSFFSDLGETHVLPKITVDGRMARVNSAHPHIAALTFVTSGTVDFFLPLTRDAELEFRDAVRDKHAKRALFGGRTRSPAASAGQGAAAARNGSGEILLSLFLSDSAQGVPVIGWRQLAELGSLPVRDRRVAVLFELARQRFGSPREMRSWWEQNRDRQRELVRCLLGLHEESLDGSLGRQDMIGHVRDLCLILGLFVERSTTRLELAQRGISEIARIFSEVTGQAGAESRSDAAHLVRILDRIIEIAT